MFAAGARVLCRRHPAAAAIGEGFPVYIYLTAYVTRRKTNAPPRCEMRPRIGPPEGNVPASPLFELPPSPVSVPHKGKRNVTNDEQKKKKKSLKIFQK